MTIVNNISPPDHGSPPSIVSPPPPIPRQNPNSLIDWKGVAPRYHGEQAEWQKFCSKLLAEIYSDHTKKYVDIFYKPVDPIELNIPDYLDIIENPMDLFTIRRKLEFKQYVEPKEFEQDMMLIINNCCKYNPKSSVLHQNALEMKTFFEDRWKSCPSDEVDPIKADTHIRQNLVNNKNVKEKERRAEKHKNDSENRGKSFQSEVIKKHNASTSYSIPLKKRNMENSVAISARIYSTRPNPNSLINWRRLRPRYHGRLSAKWRKFCLCLLTKMYGKRNEHFAHSFYLPVDPIKTNVPNYLDLIKKPMDLQTIRKKLQFHQYAKAKEFEQDVMLMINNCCRYFPKTSVLHQNALKMKAFFEGRWKRCPSDEVDPIRADTHIKQDLGDNKNVKGKEKGAEKHQKDSENRGKSVQSEEQNASTSDSMPAKKRKVENGDAISTVVASPAPPLSRTNPNTLIDWKRLVPRYNGKRAPWQKFCSELLSDIYSDRNKDFAKVFYKPVDPVKLNIPDYLDIIKSPMDIQTIWKKLEFKQYVEPKEFEQDMILMVKNCFKYYPKGSVVHQNALEMKSYFDRRWKQCPLPGIDPKMKNVLHLVNNRQHPDGRGSSRASTPAASSRPASSSANFKPPSVGQSAVAQFGSQGSTQSGTGTKRPHSQESEFYEQMPEVKHQPGMGPSLSSYRILKKAPAPQNPQPQKKAPLTIRDKKAQNASVSTIPRQHNESKATSSVPCKENSEKVPNQIFQNE